MRDGELDGLGGDEALGLWQFFIEGYALARAHAIVGRRADATARSSRPGSELEFPPAIAAGPIAASCGWRGRLVGDRAGVLSTAQQQLVARVVGREPIEAWSADDAFSFSGEPSWASGRKPGRDPA